MDYLLSALKSFPISYARYLCLLDWGSKYSRPSTETKKNLASFAVPDVFDYLIDMKTFITVCLPFSAAHVAQSADNDMNGILFCSSLTAAVSVISLEIKLFSRQIWMKYIHPYWWNYASNYVVIRIKNIDCTFYDPASEWIRSLN